MDLNNKYPKYGWVVVVPACHDVRVIAEGHDNSYVYLTSYYTCKRVIE
jgi:hypothetical protein